MYSMGFVQLKLGEIDQFLACDNAWLSRIRVRKDSKGLERAGVSTKWKQTERNGKEGEDGTKQQDGQDEKDESETKSFDDILKIWDNGESCAARPLSNTSKIHVMWLNTDNYCGKGFSY